MSKKHSYKCWICGEENLLEEEPGRRVFCDKCLYNHRKEHKKLVSEYVSLKIKIMYENALRKIENSKTYIYDYIDASKQVYKTLIEDSEKYLSSYEMIAGIILTELNYEFESNYKIGRYMVDFYIPELKACVEIDGYLHDHRHEKDNKRDIKIRSILGSDWEVVRIPTKFLDYDPSKLVDAIEFMHKKRQELRKKNHGVLPDTFSKREGTHYSKILGYKEFKVSKI